MKEFKLHHDEIVVAILAKDKEYCLDFYLHCLLNQTYDKKKMHLWIRTNDNKDNTQNILNKFVREHGSKYLSVYYNNAPISESLKNYGEHEWNPERFNILGAIRQESINYAIEKNAHYFIADCDNFITKDTIEHFFNIRNLDFVGPLLKLSPDAYYANYHNKATEYGYFQENDEYLPIWHRTYKGLIDVDTLHCTYFINNRILNDITYNDGSGRYEYAICSHALRKKGIKQYLDNTKFFGFLFLNDQIEVPFDTFIKNHWSIAHQEMLDDPEGYYDFIEIGTCDFDAIILEDNPGKGISVEALPHYFNSLPDVKGVKKINAAISDCDCKIDVHWVTPETIKKYNLPDWVRGSNTVNKPHQIVKEQMELQNLKVSYEEIATITEVPGMTWKRLVKENNVKRVKLIKLDTEGHEHIIMRDILNDLKERPMFRPQEIYFENNRLANHTAISELVQGFENLGYVFEPNHGMDSKLIYRQYV